MSVVISWKAESANIYCTVGRLYLISSDFFPLQPANSWQNNHISYYLPHSAPNFVTFFVLDKIVVDILSLWVKKSGIRIQIFSKIIDEVVAAWIDTSMKTRNINMVMHFRPTWLISTVWESAPTFFFWCRPLPQLQLSKRCPSKRWQKLCKSKSCPNSQLFQHVDHNMLRVMRSSMICDIDVGNLRY